MQKNPTRNRARSSQFKRVELFYSRGYATPFAYVDDLQHGMIPSAGAGKLVEYALGGPAHKNYIEREGPAPHSMHYADDLHHGTPSRLCRCCKTDAGMHDAVQLQAARVSIKFF